MSVNRMRRKINRELTLLNEERKLVSVFDEAISSQSYKSHRQYIRNPQKKIDNESPKIGSSSFFPQMKIDTTQRQLKQRMKNNLHLLTFFNLIHRTRGKVDTFNPIAGLRNSNLFERANEQKFIDDMNKRYSKIIKNKPPTDISNTKLLSEDFDLFMRPSIVKKMKYAIAIDSLMLPEIDSNLQCPPSPEEYRKSTKVLMGVRIVDHGHIGSIKVMLNKPYEELIDNMCESAWNFVFQPIRVFRILKGVFIEFSDLPQFDLEALKPETSDKCTKSQETLSIGTVSLILNENGTPPSKFSISLKNTTKANLNQMVVGRVVKGIDVLKAIECFGSPGGPPVRTILVDTCRVF